MPDSTWWQPSSPQSSAQQPYAVIVAAKKLIEAEAATLNFEVERVSFRLIGIGLLRADVVHRGRAVMTIDRKLEY
jgi:hypothetical protein